MFRWYFRLHIWLLQAVQIYSRSFPWSDVDYKCRFVNGAVVYRERQKKSAFFPLWDIILGWVVNYHYTVFRVGRITPYPDHRHLHKQAKKYWGPFEILPGSFFAGSQANYIQPSQYMVFFGDCEKKWFKFFVNIKFSRVSTYAKKKEKVITGNTNALRASAPGLPYQERNNLSFWCPAKSYHHREPKAQSWVLIGNVRACLCSFHIFGQW